MTYKLSYDCFFIPKVLKNSLANKFRCVANRFCFITQFKIVLCIEVTNMFVENCCKHIGTEFKLNRKKVIKFAFLDVFFLKQKNT